MQLAFLLAMALPGQVTPLVPKSPEVGYIYPPGGQAGTTLDVQIAGFNWTPDLQFFMSDPRVKLELLGPVGPVLVAPPPYWFGSKGYITSMPMPREIPARLTLPADLPPGAIRWQVANANGGSPSAGVFMVGKVPQTLEDPKGKTPAVVVNGPLALHGRLGKIEEIDRYRLRAAKSGLITCELFARRLGANLNGIVEVRDANQLLVAEAADTEGQDLAVTFLAKEGEEYSLSLHDVDFRGDRSFGYRLEITPGPRVLAAIPTTGRRGETRSVELVGVGIASGQPKVESVTRPIAFSARGTDDSFLYTLETPHGIAPAFRLFVSDRLETVAASLATDVPRPLALPSAITGCLDRPGAEHHYRCQGKKGEMWSLALEAARFRSPLDVSLAILGPDGKEAARNDDLPGTTDAGLQFTLPADGDYDLVVMDNAGKSGSRAAVYRLTAERAERDFILTAAPVANVPIGGKLDYKVSAQWQGAFREAISLQLTGLPPGVSAPSYIEIPQGQAEVLIPLQCAADALAVATRIQVIGAAKHIGKGHVARAIAPGNLAPGAPEENHLDTVLLATTMKPRCRVTTVVADGTVKVNRGATYPAELIVERFEGFTGEISLQMAAQQSYQQQGINGPDFPVPPGATRAFYPCFMPEWLETTRTSRMILIAVTKVPDARGVIRHLVTDLQGLITMSIEGNLLKISHSVRDLTVRPGQAFEVPVEILRSVKLAESVRVELLPPEDLSGLLKAEPLVVPASQTQAKVKITSTADPRLKGEHAFTLRATALQAGKYLVVSETPILVEFTAK